MPSFPWLNCRIKHAFGGIDIPHLSSRWWYHASRLALQPVIVWWALFGSGVIDWPLPQLWRRRAPRSNRSPD